MMLVSVIIPAFNAAGSIGRAIASVIGQTIDDWEIIVVDDGCEDGTADLIEKLALQDHRIRMLPNIGNKGVSAARNRGLSAAQGEWIAVLDADDAFLPERLQRLTEDAIKENADISTDNIIYFDWKARQSTGVAIIWQAATSICPINTSRLFQNTITGRSQFDFGQLKPVIRRRFLETHSILYMEDVRHGEDFLFLAYLLLAGARMILLETPYYIYTERTGSISRDRSGMTRTIENCRQMQDDTIKLLQHPQVSGDSTLIKLLHRRINAIRWHQSWEKVYYAVKKRDLRSVCIQSLADWRIPILLLSKSMAWVRNRRKSYGQPTVVDRLEELAL